jgi:hypothetical protein
VLNLAHRVDSIFVLPDTGQRIEVGAPGSLRPIFPELSARIMDLVKDSDGGVKSGVVVGETLYEKRVYLPTVPRIGF